MFSLSFLHRSRVLIHISFRLFDGTETVALIADKAAANAGLVHTDSGDAKSSSELAKSSSEMMEPSTERVK